MNMPGMKILYKLKEMIEDEVRKEDVSSQNPLRVVDIDDALPTITVELGGRGETKARFWK